MRAVDDVESFLQLSVWLTGFDSVRLQGTGMVQAYLAQVRCAAGDEVCAALWAATGAIAAEPRSADASPQGLEAAIRQRVLADTTLGPVARSLLQLWYGGSWVQLSDDWRAAHGRDPVVSALPAAAYQQGLVWQAARSHPPGARQPGFGSWATPPDPLNA